MTIDPRSVTGKRLEIAHHIQVLVIGAGPAGISAARRAHQGGADVMLVDENPVPFDVMGESVPQIWGGRMGGQVRNRNAMTERMLEARPDLVELFELGVDVRLGTACWGLFSNQPNLGWMPGLVAGLIDDEQGSYHVRADQIIVATGRRDMGLAFPGWDLPGVLGASAAATLAGLYGAFDGKRAVILGSGPEALLAAQDLMAAGVQITAVVEQAASPLAPQLAAGLQAHGVEIICGQAPRGVNSDAGGVTGLILRDRQIDCDSVLLGVGAVPMIDLLQAAGARCGFDNDRSGFVPTLDKGLQTTLAGIRAAGDCAGIWAAKSADPALARSEGEAAANAALAAIGLSKHAPADLATPPHAPDMGRYRKDWVRATVVEALAEMPVCQCEEVTAREILEVRPPRYLKMPPVANETRSLTQILGDGPPDPDQVKRLTRAGMGPCQGRRCREQIQALLALQEDLALGAVPLAGYRSPVRPMTLTAATAPEDPAIAEIWDSWFGMPRQWVPFWDVEPKYTVAALATEKEHVSE
ncbi:FAD-dependent oxidoreductase [Paracoccus laeviglucosivorans]|uniref:Pyruvate/2-oxoglutarate dehydrogenase complex, dihydrolipoamide dehydrogenase (E3) component n=1 Tax=Paracoccus laeviglucosivorans TaxID=1197861 RepID=A0A521BIW1_9RHOB|nr:FAD-dependent oxidoreductase [Paracoccus laeviglucosivorans]SMO47097.1 Pyruvate/2-oxoglutarate dehydrogenase complex, dihydrolipoamide dehydrogenase (E3) component [Paracoccus laeviglucosivorans]